MPCCSFTVRSQLGTFPDYSGLRSSEQWRTRLPMSGSCLPRSCATCREYVPRRSRRGRLKTSRIHAYAICFSSAWPRPREGTKQVEELAVETFMLLTITSTFAPATDLGYLLHKNPSRVHSFDLTFGKAHLFYPEAERTAPTSFGLRRLSTQRRHQGSRR